VKLKTKRYQATEGSVKRAISTVKEAEGEKLDGEDKIGNVFRVARQMVAQNKDVRSGCVKDVKGRSVTEEEKVLDTWKALYEKLLNEEFVWDTPVCRMSVERVHPGQDISCLSEGSYCKDEI